MTTASVVITTCRREAYVARCLEHLAALAAAPLEVLVVDATPEPGGVPSPTRAVVAAFDGRLPVRYLRSRGATAESRGIGVDAARGDVVAFVDDDVLVDPAWLDELLAPYAAPGVVGVGGRIVTGQPGEATAGLDRVGRLLPDGQLTGYFAADPGRVIDVDHLPGACMSFRRAALLDVGGVHGRYPVPGVCEEADVSLRQRARGRRLVFAPRAVVRCAPAPGTGRRDWFDHSDDRFGRRDDYLRRRNQLAMLVRVYGPTALVTRRFVHTVLRENVEWGRWTLRVVAGRVRDDAGARASVEARLREMVRALARAVVDVAGLLVGWPVGLRGLWADRRQDRDRATAGSPGLVPTARAPQVVEVP